MPDLDRIKVIKGLEDAYRVIEYYVPSRYRGYSRLACCDAIDLLREQEPVEPKVSEWLEDSDPGQEYGTTWACRKCMYSIHKPYIWNPYDSGYKYCLHCGAKMEVKLDA